MSERDYGDETDPILDVETLIQVCHENAHTAEHDVEDGVLISMTKKEIWLTVLAYLMLSQAAECLADDCAVVTERFVELLDTQKPHWRQSED